MSKKKAASTIGRSLIEGFIDYKLIKPNGEISKEQHNTITAPARAWFGVKAIAPALQNNTAICGNMIVHDSIVSNNMYSNYANRVYAKDHVLTNVLANLPNQTLTNMDEDTTFIPVTKANGEVDETKIIGYANNRLNAAGQYVEGQVKSIKEQYLVDSRVICNQWEYPEGVATGTINCIMMMPGDAVKGVPTGGLRVARCLDRIDYNPTQQSVKTTGFLPPGIGNYTSDNEILLNYQQDGVSQHKFNLSTGAYTDSPTAFAVLPYNVMDYYVEGNYLYVLIAHYKDSDLSSYDDRIYLNVYDIRTMTELSSNSSSRTFSKSAFIKYNNDLYVSVISDRSSGNTKLIKLNKDSGDNYWESFGTEYTTLSSIITLPSSYDEPGTIIGMCGPKYVLYTKEKTINSIDDAKNDVYTATIFNSLADFEGSKIDVIPEVYTTTVLLHDSNGLVGVLDINYSEQRYQPYSGNITQDFIDYSQYTNDLEGKTSIVLTNDATMQNITLQWHHGAYITYPGEYTQLWSFVELSEPIVKGAQDKLLVTYGYRVV